MAEDINKNMRKIDDDELFTVSGGLSGYNRQRPNVGTYTPGDQTVLNGVAASSNAAGSADMKGYIGNLTKEAAESMGLNTATAYCSHCMTDTLHVVVHGGMGKCTVCGNLTDKI